MGEPTRIAIKKILDEIELNQCGWEGDEDIMTFNGQPIGATLGGSREIDKWWPELKTHIAAYIAERMPTRTQLEP